MWPGSSSNAHTHLTVTPVSETTLSSTTLPTLTLRSYVLSLMNTKIPPISMRHYKHKVQWHGKPRSGGTEQKLNMKGIQRQRRKWRVQQHRDGQLKSGRMVRFKRLNEKGIWYFARRTKIIL